MDINFWGVVYGVTYFLPLLKKEKRAHIVNTSSLLGFFGASGQGAYCASKFAVRRLHGIAAPRIIGHECGSDVRASGVCAHCDCGAREGRCGSQRRFAPGKPGKIREGGAYRCGDRSREDSAGSGIAQSARADRCRCVFLDIWQRLKPASYWSLLAKQFEDPSAKTG